jgi:hypothetical protein
MLYDVLAEYAIPIVILAFPRSRDVQPPVRMETLLSKSSFKCILVSVDPALIRNWSTSKIQQPGMRALRRKFPEQEVSRCALQPIKKLLNQGNLDLKLPLAKPINNHVS